jgi:hypothetical protein
MSEQFYLIWESAVVALVRLRQCNRVNPEKPVNAWLEPVNIIS